MGSHWTGGDKRPFTTFPPQQPAPQHLGGGRDTSGHAAGHMKTHRRAEMAPKAQGHKATPLRHPWVTHRTLSARPHPRAFKGSR